MKATTYGDLRRIAATCREMRGEYHRGEYAYIGDDPKLLQAALIQIEQLVQVIRMNEGLPVPPAGEPALDTASTGTP